MDAVERGIDRATRKLSLARTELTYRHAQNIADFGTTGREQWLTATINAVNAQFSMWSTAAAPAVGLNPTLANNKVAVFYNVAVLTTPNPVSLLSFRLGAAAGTTKAVFDLEQIEAQLICEGYFSLPIAYDPQDVLNVVATSKINTGAQAQVILGCYIIEPVGTTIS
jgi:hypothetical protein